MLHIAFSFKSLNKSNSNVIKIKLLNTNFKYQEISFDIFCTYNLPQEVLIRD